MPTKIKLDDISKGNLDLVFDLLGGIGVESFIVTFDGSGDSGQLEEASDFKPEKIRKKADKLLGHHVEGARVSEGTRWSPTNGSETIWKENPDLSEIIDGICYDALGRAHPGWEINEGSYGTFTFDVKKRRANLNFHERIIETQESDFVL